MGKNEAELKKALSTTLPPDILQVLQSKLDAGKAVGNISKAEDVAKFLKYKNEGNPPHYTSQLAGDDSFVYFDPNETSNILSQVRSSSENRYLAPDYDSATSASAE